jgi:hypothetical protein
VGWEVQWDLGTVQWDKWDMFRISLVIPELWDGKDSGIQAFAHWDIGTRLVIPGHWGWKDRGFEILPTYIHVCIIL